MTEWEISPVAWRKSSHSGSSGGECVEVARVWRKSSHSADQGGTCIEVAAVDRAVAVRDSKDPDGAVLCFGRAEWGALISRLKA